MTSKAFFIYKIGLFTVSCVYITCIHLTLLVGYNSVRWYKSLI